MVSFAYPHQAALAFEICQSVVLDNGAFSLWGKGGAIDREAYLGFVQEWRQHPAFDWCLIPDKIDGTEADNRCWAEEWSGRREWSVPVWHMHESLEYLDFLCGGWPRVAIGSSGQWPNPGTESWWERIGEAMTVACDGDGRPRVKLHGLRMLDPTIFSHLPLSSADSCNVARNIGIDARWESGYLAGISKATRALVLAERFERHASAAVWNPRAEQRSLFLLG